MANTMNKIFLALLTLVFVSTNACAVGFTITLHDGTMYGPGDLGVHDINGGQLKNFVVTSPLKGYIKFFNNNKAEPNVYAEKQHTGPVDGELSDGTKINENVDAAFVIEVLEPETKMPIQLFISSVSEEVVEPDEHGNLLFKLTAAFDTGFADNVIKLPIQFTTGKVQVPLSYKTINGMKEGHDKAGPYPAKTIRIGRLGDLNSDGYLDGMFVLAGNTPKDLIIVEGDPVLITRPFYSDIPVTPQEAFFYEINGIVQNFPTVIDELSQEERLSELKEVLQDMDKRLAGAKKNLDQASSDLRPGQDKSWIDYSASQLKSVKPYLKKAIKIAKKNKNPEKVAEYSSKAISKLTDVQKNLVQVRGRLI